MYYLSLLLFSDKVFKFRSSLYNGFNDVLMLSVDINSIASSNIHCVNHHCIVVGIRKREAINLFLENADLSEKYGSL